MSKAVITAACLPALAPSRLHPLDLPLPGTQHIPEPPPTELQTQALEQFLSPSGRTQQCRVRPWPCSTNLLLGMKCSSHAQQSNVVPSAIYYPSVAHGKHRFGTPPYTTSCLGTQGWEGAHSCQWTRDHGPTSELEQGIPE